MFKLKTSTNDVVDNGLEQVFPITRMQYSSDLFYASGNEALSAMQATIEAMSSHFLILEPRIERVPKGFSFFFSYLPKPSNSHSVLGMTVEAVKYACEASYSSKEEAQKALDSTVKTLAPYYVIMEPHIERTAKGFFFFFRHLPKLS